MEHPKVTQYLAGLTQWQQALSLLRNLVLETRLTEDFKWMHPCYTLNGKNVLILHEFKDYCAISFLKGALMPDPEQLLIQPTQNSQAARQLRFTSETDVSAHQAIIKAYLASAIDIEQRGLVVKRKTLEQFEVPEELQTIFDTDTTYQKAFAQLSSGRQKGYLLHFGKPKKAQTRTNLIFKCRDRIIQGYGLRDCTCGLSKRKPNCDGSHKQLQQD